MAEVTTLSFDYSIPDLIVGKIDVSDTYQNYNSKGKGAFAFSDKIAGEKRRARWDMITP